MKLIKEKQNTTAWRLVRDLRTGDIMTGPWRYSEGAVLLNRITETQVALANGLPAPEYPINKRWTNVTETETYENYEVLDTIPTYRGSLRFYHLHNGNNSVQIVFKSANGGQYTLEGISSNEFFHRVGKGTIQMDAQGFYSFNFSFVKKSDKVFITLQPDDLDA